MGQSWQSLINFFDNLKIRNKLLSTFLGLALLPLILLTITIYQYTKGVLIRNMTYNLEAIADRQADQIRSFFREKQLEVKTAASSPFISDSLYTIIQTFNKFGLDAPEYKQSTAALEKFLNFYLQEANYDDMFLISKQGQAVFSVKRGEDLGSNYLTGVYKDTELAKVFDRATTLIGTQISDFGYYPATNEPAIFIAAPVLKNAEVIGALVFQLNNEEVYRVVNNTIGLRGTGETLIMHRAGDSITLLTPTRMDPHAAFRRYIPIHSKEGAFFNQILRGDNVKGILQDYRGKETLAVGKYFLPELGWGMIVKIDTAELFSPIANLKWLATLFSLGTAFLVALASYKIAATIAQPIVYMTEKAHVIAEGNLSESIDIHSKNEIGQLALAFNQMTTKLKNIIDHLDELIKERTLALEKAQDRLIVQEKLASLGALTAGIAHEIKNPLNFVNNFSVLSLESLEELKAEMNSLAQLTPEENALITTIKDNIHYIVDQGKKADNIVQRMLAHSHTGQGDLAKVAINQLVYDYLDLTLHGASAKNFSVWIEKQLDPSIEPIEAVADDIGRVLLNIFNNAFYAMHKKQTTDPHYQPTLKVSTKNLDSTVEITIKDNGTGMSKEVADQIFTPFFTTKPPGEGTGLGLSLSYNIIVQEHKGTIEMQTQEGVFTEFIIHLPKIAL